MKKKKEKQIDTVIKSDDEIESFAEKSDSQDYTWDNTQSLNSPPIILPDESMGSLDHSPQFVQNTPHFYFNNPYQVNYT